MSFRRYQYGDERGDPDQDLTNPRGSRFRSIVDNNQYIRSMSGGYFPLFMSYETAVLEAEQLLAQAKKAKADELKRVNYRAGPALNLKFSPSQNQTIGVRGIKNRAIDIKYDPQIKEAEDFLEAVKNSDLPRRGPGPGGASRKAQELSRAIQASKEGGGSEGGGGGGGGGVPVPSAPVKWHLEDILDEHLNNMDSYRKK